MKGRIKRDRITQTVSVIGRIKIGERIERNGKIIPTSLDYFKADGSYSAMFHKEYGERPNKVEIVFLSDNIQEVCNERYELRTTKDFDGTGGRLFASGDGEIFRVYSKDLDDYTDISIEQDPDIMKKLEKKVGSEWNVTLTLRFLIPRIRGVFGAWSFTTSADASTIPQITGTLDRLLQYPGSFAGIPMDLIVEIAHSQKPGSKSKFPVVKLIPNVSQDSLDNLKLMLDSNQKMQGILTEDRLAGYVSSHQAIEYTPQEAMTDKIHDTFANPPEKEYGNIITATELIMNSETIEALENNSRRLLTESKWKKHEKESMGLMYNDRKKQLSENKSE
jgi:hypothetical protein